MICSANQLTGFNISTLAFNELMALIIAMYFHSMYGLNLVLPCPTSSLCFSLFSSWVLFCLSSLCLKYRWKNSSSCLTLDSVLFRKFFELTGSSFKRDDNSLGYDNRMEKL